MEKEKLDKWMEILKDKNSLNVVFLYLNKWGGFKFVIDDDLLSTIGDISLKHFLKLYNEMFGKSIEKTFEPPEINMILSTPHSIVCTKCNCGWDMSEIREITKHSIYYKCKKCDSVLLTYENL